MREHRGRTTVGRWWAGWLAGVWWLVGGVPIAWAAERMALVIGNARYLNERPLVNTLNDARAVADQLRGLGFEVTLHEDLAAIPMRREANRYLEEVKGREGTVLFYYSGHGMQDRYRASYLIPVDAKVTGQEDIVAYGVGVNDILEKLGERPRDAVSLVILDACRDNPFATQKGGKGLGRVDAGRGTLVLYAAGPGQTADDRPGEPNGLFTQHLLKVLPQPGLDLEDAFDRIAEAVERASNGQQVPYKEGDLRGKYYLAGSPPGTLTATPPATPPTAPPAESPSDDQTLWQSAERCGTAACFQAYLKKYPAGQFAEMARARLQPPPSPPPVVPEAPPPVVRSPDKPAFQDLGYVCKLNPRGDNFLSLRTGPGATYPEILRMGENTILTVFEVQEPWYRVRMQDGTTGWVNRRWICRGSP